MHWFSTSRVDESAILCRPLLRKASSIASQLSSFFNLTGQLQMSTLFPDNTTPSEEMIFPNRQPSSFLLDASSWRKRVYAISPTGVTSLLPSGVSFPQWHRMTTARRYIARGFTSCLRIQDYECRIDDLSNFCLDGAMVDST